MNFEDEHYVRIYTRDTKTWKRLGFEGQTVLMHVWRRLDKAGVLDDIDDPVTDVALVTDIPVDFVAVGLPKLLAYGVLEHRGNCLVAPRYIEGQTAKKSDAARSRDVRQRRRAEAMSASRNVTGESRGVTRRHEEDKADELIDELVTSHEKRETVTGESRNVTLPSQGVTESHEASLGRRASACAEQRSAGAEETPPPPPLVSLDPSKPFRLTPDWDPGHAVLMGSAVPPWAHTPLLVAFRLHHCNGGATRTETQWRQSYARWASRDWQDPKTRPVKPDESEGNSRSAESKAERQARLKAEFDRGRATA